MKKTTMQTIVSYLTSVDALPEVVAELSAELAKGAEKAQANREAYQNFHDLVIAALASANAPVTAQELADETGISRGKITYGIKNYWGEEIEVDSTGKVNKYSLK